MHWITGPDNGMSRLLHSLDVPGKVLVDLINTVASDEGDLSWALVGIQDVQKVNQLLGLHAGSTLDSNRVLDSSEVLDVCAVELSCPVTNPDKVSSDVVVFLLCRVCGVGHEASQGLFVLEQETLVGCKDVDSVEGA